MFPVISFGEVGVQKGERKIIKTKMLSKMCEKKVHKDMPCLHSTRSNVSFQIINFKKKH